MNPINSSRARLLVTTIGLAMVAVGCSDESVRVYQVPKEPAHAQPPPSSTERPNAPTAHVRWDSLPANWKDRPVTGKMRAAEIGITGSGGQEAELVAIPLPELAGKELEFVNMWREQINLTPTTTAAIAELREPLSIAGNPGQLFDMVSDKPLAEGQPKQRILVAMATIEGTTWFFKLTGTDELVAQEKANLKGFLEKVELHAATEDDPHAGLASAPPTQSPPPAAPAPGLPKWTVPAGWTAATPGPMLLASFDLSGGGGKVTVSSLGGDGGGLLMNVNRWRGQIGLSPVTGDQLSGVTKEIDVASGKATLVDLSNNDRRMLIFVVPHQGQSWFYKLLGDAGAVAKEMDAFLQFAKSAQY